MLTNISGFDNKAVFFASTLVQSTTPGKGQVEIPSSVPNLSHSYPVTTYDILLILPTLLSAATPLILGYLQYRDKNKNEKN